MPELVFIDAGYILALVDEQDRDDASACRAGRSVRLGGRGSGGCRVSFLNPAYGLETGIGRSRIFAPFSSVPVGAFSFGTSGRLLA